MTKKVALLFIHGMGELFEAEFQAQVEQIVRTLRDDLSNPIEFVHVGRIFYQDILQNRQVEVFQRLQAEGNLDWLALREFLLFGFSDAASLEYRAYEPGSEYEQAQLRILAALDAAYEALSGPNQPVVIMAQSLGSHIISNYLWDAQTAAPTQGVWRPDGPASTPLNADHDNFRRLKTLKFILTTGCNIPIFTAGKRSIQAVKTRSDGYDITWHNYYDADDVLGWPLRPLGQFFNPAGEGSAYNEAVDQDIEMNVRGGLLDWATESWNPLSHRNYWRDGRIIQALAAQVDALLSVEQWPV
ncbi:MAG: hypothetical protein R3264_10155 [Anaerolineae bacterium]|nr:hypothetical protein [Anaerolineae bacterium]